jgi:hypothetical protein
MHVVQILLKVTGWLMLAIAIITLPLSFFTYAHSQRFIKSANRAQGTVIRLDERSGSGSRSVYYPVYTFQDSQGKQHEIYSSSGSYPPSYEVGEKVTVLYQSDNPSNAEIDSFMDKWLFTVLLAGFGLIGLFLGIGMFIAAFMIGKAERRRQIVPPKI